RAQRRRQVRHLGVPLGAARGPPPHLAGAEGRLASQRALEQREVHRAYGGSAMRLAKYLAQAGVASRRAAEGLVAGGRVTVDGEVVADPARDVGDGAAVALDGEPVGPEPREVYALNKPAGVVSTARDTHG